MSDVTQILCAIEHGDPQAAEQLLPLVYDELRRLAAEKMAQEKPGQTLQATALDRRVAWLDEEGYPDLPVIWSDNRGLLGAQTFASLRAVWQRAERRKTNVRSARGA
jgi:hypothetical protein